MLTALTIGSQALGQTPPPPSPGAVSKVAFSLTITDEAPGTVAKDPATGKPLKKGTEGAGPAYENEYDVFKGKAKVARIDEYIATSTKRKYSTKEFLTDLKRIGVITDIKGWSLVQVTRTDFYTASKTIDITPAPTEEIPNPVPVPTNVANGTVPYPGDSGFFLINKSVAEPIDVSNHFDAFTFEDDGVYLTDVDTESTPYSSEGTLTPAQYALTKHFFEYTWRGDARLRIDLNQSVPAEGEESAYNIGESISMYGGLGTGGVKSGLLKDKTTGVYLPLAEKADGLSGGYYYDDQSDEEDGNYSFVEGGFSISAGVVQDDVLDFFPEEVE